MKKDDLIPIRISTLRAGVPLRFNVFIHFQDRYLPYKKPSETFEGDKIEKFSSKKIKKVFIPVTEEPEYLQYLDAALDDLKSAAVSTEAKAEFAQQTMASEAENIEKNLDSEAGFQQTQARISKVIDFVSSEPTSLKSLLASAGVSVDNSAHSSTVASLSMALAGAVGLKDPTELMSISIAALLHDVGVAKLGFDPMTPEKQIPKSALAKWRQHPAESVNMLAGKKFITPRVLKLIADHHEIGEGDGFPDKKRLKKLPTSSQIFNLADHFDHYCSGQQLAAPDAFDGFVETSSSYFDMMHLEKLERLLKS